MPGQGRGKEKLARKSDWRKEQRLLGIRDTAQMHTEDKSGHILAEKQTKQIPRYVRDIGNAQLANVSGNIGSLSIEDQMFAEASD